VKKTGREEGRGGKKKGAELRKMWEGRLGRRKRWEEKRVAEKMSRIKDEAGRERDEVR
jgi:hypothetical protein